MTIFPCCCRRCRQSKSATIDNSFRKALFSFLKILFSKRLKHFNQIIKKLCLTGLPIIFQNAYRVSPYQKLLYGTVTHLALFKTFGIWTTLYFLWWIHLLYFFSFLINGYEFWSETEFWLFHRNRDSLERGPFPCMLQFRQINQNFSRQILNLFLRFISSRHFRIHQN